MGLLAPVNAKTNALAFRNRRQLPNRKPFWLGLSAVAALLFSGFILYDTNRLVRVEEDNYVMAAVIMYLNVLNLFLSVLQLLGFSSND